MGQLIEKHIVDGEQMPTGGTTCGKGIIICWQDGPLGRGKDRKEPNGAFVEDVIRAALGRMKFYQISPFECAENDNAIRCLEDALYWLNRRTQDREARGVEGIHKL